MKSLLSTCFALFALACAGSSNYNPGRVQYETGRYAATTGDGLHRVKMRHVGAAYLRPGADFSGYRGVLFEPVEVFYKNPPASPRGFSRENYALEPRDMERLRNLFQEALENEFAESHVFSITDQPAADVLRVRAHLVDIVVLTPPQRSDHVYVGDAGELTMILDVSDSQSRVPLARLSERAKLTPPGVGVEGTGVDLNRPGYEWGQLRRLFRKWSSLLRGGLEALPSLGPVPPPPGSRPPA